MIETLLKELKRLDDKMLLMEVQLLESKAYYALKNIPKSRVRKFFFYFYLEKRRVYDIFIPLLILGLSDFCTNIS
jgi:hypothetical protein